MRIDKFGGVQNKAIVFSSLFSSRHEQIPDFSVPLPRRGLGRRLRPQADGRAQAGGVPAKAAHHGRSGFDQSE